MGHSCLWPYEQPPPAGRRVPCADPDRWHPAYPDSTVTIAVYVWRDVNPRGRAGAHVGAWGRDDTGLELAYEGPDLDAFVAGWSRWITNVGLVSYEMLLALGFSRA